MHDRECGGAAECDGVDLLRRDEHSAHDDEDLLDSVYMARLFDTYEELLHREGELGRSDAAEKDRTPVEASALRLPWFAAPIGM